MLTVPPPTSIGGMPVGCACQHGLEVCAFERAVRAVKALVIACRQARQILDVVVGRVSVEVMNLMPVRDGAAVVLPDVPVEVSGTAWGAEVSAIALADGVRVAAVHAASVRSGFCPSHTVIVSSA